MIVKIINDREGSWYGGMRGLLLHAWEIPGVAEYLGCGLIYNPTTETPEMYFIVSKKDVIIWQR